jgi:hypothetical protein
VSWVDCARIWDCGVDIRFLLCVWIVVRVTCVCRFGFDLVLIRFPDFYSRFFCLDWRFAYILCRLYWEYSLGGVL